MLGTERHESRRIDNQLRGRSGRQGDPGESRFYLSAQDEVIRLFAGERIYKILDSRFGPPDGEPIEAKMLTNKIEGAQKKVEEFHFVNRKNVVKYDDVMNEQRKQVYATRREILEGGDLREILVDGSEEQPGWIEQVIEAAVGRPHRGGVRRGLGLGGDVGRPALGLSDAPRDRTRSIARRSRVEDLLDRIFDDAAGFYEERETEWGPELARSVERFITLQVLDTRWREHLDNVDYLRQGIGLRGYAQKDPLVEYKLEAELMFGEMDMLVKQEVVRFLMHAEVQVEETPQLDQHAAPGELRLPPRRRRDARGARRRRGRGRHRRRARAERLPRRRAAPARPRARRSAATIRAGAGPARSSSGAMAHKRRGDGAAVARRPARRGRGVEGPAALGP